MDQGIKRTLAIFPFILLSPLASVADSNTPTACGGMPCIDLSTNGSTQPITSLEPPCTMNEFECSGTHAGQRSCKDVLLDIEKDLKANIKQAVHCRYQNIFFDPTTAAKKDFISNLKNYTDPSSSTSKDLLSSQNACPGTQAKACVINLPPSGVPEIFEEPSCPETGWPTFHTHVRPHKCIVKPIYSDQPIEDKFNAGAWVRAWDYSYPEVMNEIKAGKLNIKSAYCQEIAKDFKTTSAIFVASPNIKDLTRECCPVAGATQFPNRCASKLKEDESSNACTNQSISSACDLANSRINLESQFKILAHCEALMRADALWIRFLGTTLGPSDIAQEARTQINHVEGRRAQCTHDFILGRYKDTLKNSILPKKIMQVFGGN